MIKREDVGTRFAIHASREIDAHTFASIYEIDPGLRPELATTKVLTRWHQLSRITSAVIAVATLDSILDPLACGIAPDHPDAVAPLALDQPRWFFGPIGYVLRDVVALKTPVQCRGWQGFWTLAPDVERAVVGQLA